jgi:hypothetical protein
MVCDSMVLAAFAWLLGIMVRKYNVELHRFERRGVRMCCKIQGRVYG